MPPAIDVRYFAAARELAGTDHDVLTLSGDAMRVSDVLALLAARHARLAPLVARMRLAVNGELAFGEDVVRAGDEVSVLPPVAGGAPRLCSVRAAPLSLDEALAAVRHPGAGALVVFLGTVRDHADDKPVARLDYEAHLAMAEREMGRVLDAIEHAAPGVRLAALHRTGILAVGEIAVVVAASAAHRAEAFAACREAIDRIKERVPIWKKEWAPDGAAHWVNLE